MGKLLRFSTLSVFLGTAAWAAPSAPTLNFPPDTRLTSDRTPSFDWSDVAGAASYRLEISANASFSPVLLSLSGITASFYSLTGAASEKLSRGNTYHWRVIATDASGDSPPSASRQLRVGLNTITYILDIGKTSPLSPPLVLSKSVTSSDPMTSTSNSTTLTDIESLENNLSFFWRITARDAGGNASASTPERKFTVNNAFPVPSLIVPADGSKPITRTPFLDWTDVSGATSYTLWLSTRPDLSPLLLSPALAASQYQVTTTDNLQSLTTYHWKVKAAGGGQASFSNTQSFLIVPLTPASLLFPPDNRLSSDRTPTFQWTTPDDMTGLSFTMEMSLSSSFSSLLFSQSGIPAGSYTLSGQGAQNLERGKTYYWRVKTIDSQGQPLTSASRSLRVGLNTITYTLEIDETSPLLSPMVVLPVVITPPVLNPIILNPITITLDEFSALASASDFYWRVSAADAAGNGVTGAEREFTVQSPYPAPMSLSPADGAVVHTKTPLVDWSDASGSTSYVVRFSSRQDFKPILIEKPISASQYQAVSADNLQELTTYYWQVKALGGPAPTYSGTRAFFVRLNQPPALSANPAGDQQALIDQTKTMSFAATDADGDALTLTAGGLPGFCSFIDNGGGTAAMTCSPASADAGTYAGLSVTATDGIDSTSLTFILTVRAVGCGDTLTSTFAMSGNLSCNYTGLILSGSDLTLDCAGHTITYANAADAHRF